jgi:tetratricopeptide (TPR) repeat protein
MALAEVERDHDGAVGAYRQAIVAAPTDAELYSELDDVYREAGADLDTRLANIQAGLRHGTSDDLATDAARLLNEAGRYRETLDLLAAQHFNIWEGSSSIHRLYEEAHVSSGIAAHESGNYPTALEHFEQAMEYPENLGEARSERDQLARPKYWAGRAQEALGRGEEAAVLYRAATEEEYRRVSPSQYYQGLAYRALGQESEADGVFRDLIDSAEDSRGGSLMATLLAGLGHHGLGQQQKAEELLRSFLADPALSSSGGRSGWRRRYAIRHVGLVRQILAE